MKCRNDFVLAGMKSLEAIHSLYSGSFNTKSSSAAPSYSLELCISFIREMNTQKVSPVQLLQLTRHESSCSEGAATSIAKVWF